MRAPVRLRRRLRSGCAAPVGRADPGACPERVCRLLFGKASRASSRPSFARHPQCRQDDILVQNAAPRVMAPKGWRHGRRRFFSHQSPRISQAPRLAPAGGWGRRRGSGRGRHFARWPGSSSRSPGGLIDPGGGTPAAFPRRRPLIRPCCARGRRGRPSWRLPAHGATPLSRPLRKPWDRRNRKKRPVGRPDSGFGPSHD